ncbi:MAG: helix-hairpin-helix domain-containing protein [Flavobacteriaceae bacterium]|nr:helix-hairpin-helix domain-containing protein [Flavobacteriaceae bacterium]
MKNIKSHFWYNKDQRNGILFLSIFIVLLQLTYFFVDFSPHKVEDLNTLKLTIFQSKIDSLKSIELEKRKPKIYPFNPSFITDYKGYKLGMTTPEIDKLLAFRKAGNYINSAKQFQQITGINDSLFNTLKPFFKFPDWVNKDNSYPKIKIIPKDLNNVTEKDLQLINGIGKVLSARIIKYRTSIGGFSNSEQLKKVYGLKSEVVTKITNHYPIKEISNPIIEKFIIKDLNKVTAEELKSVNGIGDKLSKRIIKTRNTIGGFQFIDQLNEVYGLKLEVISKLLKQFQLLSKPKIIKLNINEATFKQILHLPYIDYDLTKKIAEYKDEFAEIQDLKELKKIEGFPIDKYGRIVLYLTTEYKQP